MSRQTIGENPLDTLLPPGEHVNGVETAVTALPTHKPVQRDERPKKNRLTVQISDAAIEKLKDAVYWTPGATLADVAEQAILNHVHALEEERGQAFPKRSGQLKTGRPMK